LANGLDIRFHPLASGLNGLANGYSAAAAAAVESFNVAQIPGIPGAPVTASQGNISPASVVGDAPGVVVKLGAHASAVAPAVSGSDVPAVSVQGLSLMRRLRRAVAAKLDTFGRIFDNSERRDSRIGLSVRESPASEAAPRRHLGKSAALDNDAIRAHIRPVIKAALGAAGASIENAEAVKSALDGSLRGIPGNMFFVAALARERDGWLVRVADADNHSWEFKAFDQDVEVLDRMDIPAELQSIYEEHPDGAIRRVVEDPIVPRLRRSGIELWAVRHGENIANRQGLLNGSGTDLGLTDTPDANGNHGRMQAASAAEELYARLGGDSWARQVLAGESPALVILQSPLLRARQTADALQQLLDEKKRSLGGGWALYEEDIAPELKEIGYGRLDGQLMAEAKKLPFWQIFDCYKGLGRGFLDKFPGENAQGRSGESRFDVMLRQRDLFERILKKYDGQRVVLFSHFETMVAQQAVLGLLSTDEADGSFMARPIEHAKPLLLVAGGAGSSKAPAGDAQKIDSRGRFNRILDKFEAVMRKLFPSWAKRWFPPAFVSACLLALNCRYDKRPLAAVGNLLRLAAKGRVIWFCPEEGGGLPTPRPPSKIVGGNGDDVLDGRARVMTSAGVDVTAQFLRGAQGALAKALAAGCRLAYLKSRSPSCDAAYGVTAALLKRAGIAVVSVDSPRQP